MTTTRISFTIDRALVERARRLRVNVSAAARQGVEAAVRAAMARARPERVSLPSRTTGSFLVPSGRLDQRVTRREIGFAEAGHKERPVLILTRPEVIEVPALAPVDGAEDRPGAFTVTASDRLDQPTDPFDAPPSTFDRPIVCGVGSAAAARLDESPGTAGATLNARH